MRLIDADKLRLVKCGEYDSGKPINCIYEWAIKDAPTVKAIPIEWIEEWIKTCIPHYDYDRMTYVADVYEMLEDWEKENEG